jgi:uncharacterized protein YcbX
MQVAGLWRYPIKSLGGEPLEAAELTRDGVAGDRLVHVRTERDGRGGRDGRAPVTGRTRHGLLTQRVRTDADGVPTVGGHRWDSPATAQIIRAVAGPGARLVAYDGPERFDVLNLLVATDGAVASLGHDVRRLRPNLLLGGVPAEAEATWPGRALAIGDALIGVHSLRQRCIVTTIDPDTGARDLDVLRRIRDDFDGEIALNCWVIRPGAIRVGQTAELVETDAVPEWIGGWTVGAPYAAA